MAADEQTAGTVAKLLDISPRRLQQLHKEGVIPKGSRGKYPLVASVQGYIHYLRERHVSTDSSEKLDYRRERALHTRAQRIKTELEVEVFKGRLVEKDVVELDWINHTLSMRSKLLALAPKLATQAMAADSLREVQDYVTDQIHEALAELSDDAELTANTLGTTESDSESPKTATDS